MEINFGVSIKVVKGKDETFIVLDNKLINEKRKVSHDN